MGGVRLSLILLMETLGYLDFCSYMGETERKKETRCWHSGLCRWRRYRTRLP